MKQLKKVDSPEESTRQSDVNALWINKKDVDDLVKIK